MFTGVADQLQTNYATDMRHILKAVFDCNTSEAVARLEAAEDEVAASPSTSGNGPADHVDSIHSDGRTERRSRSRGESDNDVDDDNYDDDTDVMVVGEDDVNGQIVILQYG